MAYESLVYNIGAHAAIANAIKSKSHDIVVFKVGSSHVGQNGYGWIDGLTESLHDLGQPIVSSPLYGGSKQIIDPNGGLPDIGLPEAGNESPDDTARFTSGLNYSKFFPYIPSKFRAAKSTLDTQAQLLLISGSLTGNPAAGTADLIQPGKWFNQTWYSAVQKTNNSVGITPSVTAGDNAIGVPDGGANASTILKGNVWICTKQPEFTGNITLGYRLGGAAPFKSQSFAQTTDQLVQQFSLDLTAAELPGTWPTVTPHFQVSNTSGTLNKICLYWANLENNKPFGFMCHPLVHYGGAAAKAIAAETIAPNSTYWLRHYIAWDTQVRSTRNKLYIFDINLGHNDRNDVTLSNDGVNNSNTADGLIANAKLIQSNILSSVGLQIDHSRIFFRWRIDTPVSFPDDTNLVAYRAAFLARINEFHQSVYLDSFNTGTSGEYAGWWLSVPLDQVHLNNTGYYNVERRFTEGYLSRLDSISGKSGLGSYWKHQLTGG